MCRGFQSCRYRVVLTVDKLAKQGKEPKEASHISYIITSEKVMGLKITGRYQQRFTSALPTSGNIMTQYQNCSDVLLVGTMHLITRGTRKI